MRPVLFSVMVIIVALIPLFTMQGVPGKIFGPMSITYGFALTGAMIFAIFFAPVLSSFRGSGKHLAEDNAHRIVVAAMVRAFGGWSLSHRARRSRDCGRNSGDIALGLLHFVGGEFMPKLEEGNLWIRATLPQDVSWKQPARCPIDMREILLNYPEVTQVVSQTGRPDDGTDVTTFNNIEFMVSLKTPDRWPGHISKDD